jgi:hypothetical protein
MSELILREPPVVPQRDRHICWAAAYESWARAQGVAPAAAAATRMVELLNQVGRGADAGHGVALDDDERLLPDGVGTFGALANMRIRLLAPAAMTAELLLRALRQGYVWLWGTPRHGHVAHIVVVYGVDAQRRALYMDPLVGLQRVAVHEMARRMRAFAVGTPLVRRPTAAPNPFAGMSSREVHLPPAGGGALDPFLMRPAPRAPWPAGR